MSTITKEGNNLRASAQMTKHEQ